MGWEIHGAVTEQVVASLYLCCLNQRTLFREHVNAVPDIKPIGKSCPIHLHIGVDVTFGVEYQSNGAVGHKQTNIKYLVYT